MRKITDAREIKVGQYYYDTKDGEVILIIRVNENGNSRHKVISSPMFKSDVNKISNLYANQIIRDGFYDYKLMTADEVMVELL